MIQIMSVIIFILLIAISILANISSRLDEIFKKIENRYSL